MSTAGKGRATAPTPSWYERAPSPWKWRVTRPRWVYVPELSDRSAKIHDHRTGKLLARLEDGWIFALPEYRWDGATGAIDRGLMLPSLFHDILCQMAREGLLRPKRWARRIADLVFRRVSKAVVAGEPRLVRTVAFFRRWIDWGGVRVGGWLGIGG